MTTQNEDPRLTAYALGELAADEQAEVEALLARDGRVKAELAAIRDVSSRLERGLSAVGGPALSDEQRARIFAALEPTGVSAPNGVTKVFGIPSEVPTAAAPERDGSPKSGSVGTIPRRKRKVWLLLAALLPSIGALTFVVEGMRSADESPLAAIAVPSERASATPARPLAAPEQVEVPAGRPIALADGRAASAPPADSWAFAEGARLRAESRMDRPTPQRATAATTPQYAAGPSIGSSLGGVSKSTLAPEVSGARGVLLGRQPSTEFNFDAPARELAEPPLLDRESYDAVSDNPFVRVATDARSTFSIDVDTASYALVRRFLQSGQLPPKGAARIEELVNYFSYEYPEPSGGAPFAVVADVARAPWAEKHRLVRIGIKARHIPQQARPAANLVFLIDVSGSMASADKLPLVKYGLQRLAASLDGRDRVSMVVYAGASGLVLDAARGDRQRDILGALDRLEAGGSTNGGQGIQLAYELARRHFVKGGVNRVILATDGDFNVGITSQSELVDLIREQAKSGVYLSVLGFGTGNYQDSTLEKLADEGNGNYAYIDDASEAQKVLVEQINGTLVTVAKDVKLQLEFNPAEVEAFRLIGYENRVLAHQDFNDDSKDAGEIGADHDVTALYEVIPKGGQVPGGSASGRDVDDLRYQSPATGAPDKDRTAHAGELLHVKLRHQPPEGGASQLTELTVQNTERALAGDFRFAAAVAQFGMLLRESPYRGSSSYDGVLELARSALGSGKEREAREELITLVRKARDLARSKREAAPSKPCGCPPGDPLCSCIE